MPRRIARAVGRLHRIVGGPGIMIALTSVAAFVLGLVVLILQYDRPRSTEREAIRWAISAYARAPYHPGLNLIDRVEAWRDAAGEDRASRRGDVAAMLRRMGDDLDVQEERFPLVRVVALDLGPRGGEPLASWRPRGGASPADSDRVDRIPILPGVDPPIELSARFRADPAVERLATGLESSYRRLLIAVAVMSGYSLLCLAYMVLQARTLRDRAAREAAREATLDLADRACHEIGNGVFVLANERRNLAGHLDLVDRFVADEAAARASAARRAGLDAETIDRLDATLRREYAARGIDPAEDLRASASLARDVCRQIAACSEFLALTVRDLDGHLKHADSPAEVVDLDVDACVSEALALLGPRLDAADARVERPEPAVPGLLARGDRRLLIQAMVNLVKNAIEAAAGAGIAPVLGISTRVEGGHVRVEVVDNGPGLPPVPADRLFEEGFTTKGTGRGRGLSIIHRSIAAQGGVLSAETRPPRGAAFSIDLPASDAPEPPPSSL